MYRNLTISIQIRFKLTFRTFCHIFRWQSCVLFNYVHFMDMTNSVDVSHYIQNGLLICSYRNCSVGLTNVYCWWPFRQHFLLLKKRLWINAKPDRRWHAHPYPTRCISMFNILSELGNANKIQGSRSTRFTQRWRKEELCSGHFS